MVRNGALGVSCLQAGGGGGIKKKMSRVSVPLSGSPVRRLIAANAALNLLAAANFQNTRGDGDSTVQETWSSSNVGMGD